jgi:hypothetical protein
MIRFAQQRFAAAVRLAEEAAAEARSAGDPQALAYRGTIVLANG